MDDFREGTSKILNTGTCTYYMKCGFDESRDETISCEGLKTNLVQFRLINDLFNQNVNHGSTGVLQVALIITVE